jgi:glutamate 5-kinase
MVKQKEATKKSKSFKMLYMKKIVIKFGSSSLTNGSKQLCRPQMVELVRQLCHLHAIGHEIIVVSSGAIAAGRELLSVETKTTCLPTKQMMASIGQVKLMHTWSELFSIYGVMIGQILLTREDISDIKRAENAKNTFYTLLEHRVIPIVNENDSVATEEIRFGDNDTLSALVAQLIGADLLILLTDQEGLYTADPRLHTDAKLIQFIDNIDDSIKLCARDSSNPHGIGTGGMATKVEAARIATQTGATVTIASSKEPNVLIELLAGKQIGTTFQICG